MAIDPSKKTGLDRREKIPDLAGPPPATWTRTIANGFWKGAFAISSFWGGLITRIKTSRLAEMWRGKAASNELLDRDSRLRFFQWEIQAKLQGLVQLITDGFISRWYTFLSNDTTFPKQVSSLLTRVVNVVRSWGAEKLDYAKTAKISTEISQQMTAFVENFAEIRRGDEKESLMLRQFTEYQAMSSQGKLHPAQLPFSEFASAYLRGIEEFSQRFNRSIQQNNSSLFRSFAHLVEANQLQDCDLKDGYAVFKRPLEEFFKQGDYSSQALLLFAGNKEPACQFFVYYAMRRSRWYTGEEYEGAAEIFREKILAGEINEKYIEELITDYNKSREKMEQWGSVIREGSAKELESLVKGGDPSAKGFVKAYMRQVHIQLRKLGQHLELMQHISAEKQLLALAGNPSYEFLFSCCSLSISQELEKAKMSRFEAYYGQMNLVEMMEPLLCDEEGLAPSSIGKEAIKASLSFSLYNSMEALHRDRLNRLLLLFLSKESKGSLQEKSSALKPQRVSELEAEEIAANVLEGSDCLLGEKKEGLLGWLLPLMQKIVRAGGVTPPLVNGVSDGLEQLRDPQMLLTWIDNFQTSFWKWDQNKREYVYIEEDIYRNRVDRELLAEEVKEKFLQYMESLFPSLLYKSKQSAKELGKAIYDLLQSPVISSFFYQALDTSLEEIMKETAWQSPQRESVESRYNLLMQQQSSKTTVEVKMPILAPEELQQRVEGATQRAKELCESDASFYEQVVAREDFDEILKREVERTLAAEKRLPRLLEQLEQIVMDVFVAPYTTFLSASRALQQSIAEKLHRAFDFFSDRVQGAVSRVRPFTESLIDRLVHNLSHYQTPAQRMERSLPNAHPALLSAEEKARLLEEALKMGGGDAAVKALYLQKKETLQFEKLQSYYAKKLALVIVEQVFASELNAIEKKMLIDSLALTLANTALNTLHPDILIPAIARLLSSPEETGSEESFRLPQLFEIAAIEKIDAEGVERRLLEIAAALGAPKEERRAVQKAPAESEERGIWLRAAAALKQGSDAAVSKIGEVSSRLFAFGVAKAREVPVVRDWIADYYLDGEKQLTRGLAALRDPHNLFVALAFLRDTLFVQNRDGAWEMTPPTPAESPEKRAADLQVIIDALKEVVKVYIDGGTPDSYWGSVAIRIASILGGFDLENAVGRAAQVVHVLQDREFLLNESLYLYDQLFQELGFAVEEVGLEKQKSRAALDHRIRDVWMQQRERIHQGLHTADQDDQEYQVLYQRAVEQQTPQLVNNFLSQKIDRLRTGIPKTEP